MIRWSIAILLILAATPTHAQDTSDPSTETASNRPRIDAYRSNYFTYNTRDVNKENQDGRLKFQISVRSNLVRLTGDAPLRLDLTYTMLAFWEVFEESSPFKEYNHNPEVFFRWSKGMPSWMNEITGGWMHESNGLHAGPDNRSWDRAFLEPRLVYRMEQGPFDALHAFPRFWWVWDTAEENRSILEAENISGRFGANLVLVLTQRSGAGRFRLEIGRKYRSLELHLNTLPGLNNYSTFVQIHNGQGESLIGFDDDTTSLGAGIAFLMGPSGR